MDSEDTIDNNSTVIIYKNDVLFNFTKANYDIESLQEHGLKQPIPSIQAYIITDIKKFLLLAVKEGLTYEKLNDKVLDYIQRRLDETTNKI